MTLMYWHSGLSTTPLQTRSPKLGATVGIAVGAIVGARAGAALVGLSLQTPQTSAHAARICGWVQFSELEVT
jgi:hypothetical protein